MTFPRNIVEDLLVACHRCCCLCHKYCGTKIEIHHIIPRSKGGQDTLENAIALCFDCHAEVESYNTKHPKGRRFSPSELMRHKEQWLKLCSNINISKKTEKASKVFLPEKESYTKKNDSFYQQSEEIIKELEDRRKKINVPDSSFIASLNPSSPVTKSIFQSFEEWTYERKDINDDIQYCEKNYSKMKTIFLALRAENRKFLQPKLISLEQSLKELKDKKNEFLRLMQNLIKYEYERYMENLKFDKELEGLKVYDDYYNYSLNDFKVYRRDHRAANDVCEEYDIKCKENMIIFFDKALEVLYSITKACLG
ncbi:MAG: HNH endonuclease [Candidatus Methanofastidiosia archaeon]|jgi:hypothetical protein